MSTKKNAAYEGRNGNLRAKSPSPFQISFTLRSKKNLNFFSYFAQCAKVPHIQLSELSLSKFVCFLAKLRK